MPSPFEGKRVLLLYKAASLCFDPPLFELSSLAGRVSDIPDTGHSVHGKGSRRGSCALREKQAISVRVIVQSSARQSILWSRFHFCSLLKTNICQ